MFDNEFGFGVIESLARSTSFDDEFGFGVVQGLARSASFGNEFSFDNTLIEF